jgi:putative ABC transport system ATP-binding protein
MTNIATVSTGTAELPVLRGENLRKSFGSTVALAGVDFSIHRGEAVAIMGPSGSGKSTLLHCLAGIMQPDSGQVHLMDQRIDTMSESKRSRLRRTRFGFLFQFGQLLPELPADENVALPMLLGGSGKTESMHAARQWFPALGLQGLHQRRPGELSGGQAQRVALARALITGPAVVFADEPTGALDQATGDEVMRTLIATTKEHSTSVVVVTHDVAVARHCDRVIEVRDGKITGVPDATSPRTGPSPATAADSAAAPRPRSAGAW